MQVRSLIVQPVAVNVVDDLAAFGSSNLTVFPLPTPDGARALSLCAKRRAVGAIRFFNFWGCCRRREFHHPAVLHGDIPAPKLAAGRHRPFLFIVSVQRIAVVAAHLVVAHAKLLCGYRPIAMKAPTPNDLSSPSVLGGAVFTNPLVMHEAVAVRGMFSTATTNRARFHGGYPSTLYKALGNSMAVPVMAWIGRQIDRAIKFVEAA